MSRNVGREPGGVGSQVKRPILVAGVARSGTTWVGRTLTAGGEAEYVDEPLNIRRSFGVEGLRGRRWYAYITLENEEEHLAGLQDALAFRYSFISDVRHASSYVDVLHAAKLWRRSLSARVSRKRAVVKEPHAAFSAEWFVRRLGCDCVVTVRHPAAVASSWKRLGWTFDFTHLLDQPLLMRERLEPFRTEMEDARSRDPISQAALLWRLVYFVVADYSRQVPGVRVVRHEDLARDPVGSFADLYALLGLSFTEGARLAVAKSSDHRNPSEATRADPYSVTLDTAANLELWRTRLTSDEIARVRATTEHVARQYYSDADWDS
jgi:hypothetical protein